jgi:GH3 auxin-responsive promoter
VPDIRLVTTWMGGSCGIALDALRRKLPPKATVMELGYQSSEFRGTIALEAETPHGLPPLHHHFFEFVEQAKWDSGNACFLTLDQVEAGRPYYVLITTASGLYRYFMNDLVEVSGFFHRTPLLRFIQKGKGVTSLTGEKLYEGQAIDAVVETTGKFGVTSSFFLLVADEKISAYHLFVESDDGGRSDTLDFVAAVDRRLGELNIEYHGKRASGRLQPLDVVWLKLGAGEAYKMACVRAGQREGQFKPVVLQYRKDLRFSFDDYVAA